MQTEIAKNPVKPIYLKRSVILYKIYGSLFLFSIFVSVFIRPIFKNYPDIVDLLMGLPVLSLFVMAPMGVFYSLKSYKRKEGLSKIRLRYLLGHIFFVSSLCSL